MNSKELLNIISAGEASKVQFKQAVDDDSIAAEMIAMSNSKGGIILLTKPAPFGLSRARIKDD
ncbi:MAG: ATP-binding protein [Prevotellaceae bacterium]|jgi:predicted HTH transcriptional regulator|nr:ATP-binding protein [Prevotellaceae bacterium]